MEISYARPRKIVDTFGNEPVFYNFPTSTHTTIEWLIQQYEKKGFELTLTFYFALLNAENATLGKKGWEYNSAIKRDNKSILDDRTDLTRHIKIGLIKAANDFYLHNTGQVNEFLAHVDVPGYAASIQEDLEKTAFYKGGHREGSRPE